MNIRHALDDEGPRFRVVAGAGAAASVAVAAVFAVLAAVPASGTVRHPEVGHPAVQDVRDGAGRDRAWCPSLPSVEFVGAPWAARVPGCPRLSRWWRYVDIP